MLDIILIQHAETGINLLEYRQVGTKFDKDHADIFSGFLTAIQNITEELDIGTVVLISTEGSKGHNCIIVRNERINIIILMDQEDPIDLWREQAKIIGNEFLEEFGKDFEPHHITKFKKFKDRIKELCLGHEYCE